MSLAIQKPTIVPVQPARPRPALFRALGKDDPPARIHLLGQPYSRVEIFKHDSWAATALYQGLAGQLIVCKFNRRQTIFGIPMRWLGHFLAHREANFLRRFADLAQIPRWSGKVFVDGQEQTNAVAHSYIPGHPLGSRESLDEAFFAGLGRLLGQIHGRGVAYMDLHKRENILVGEDGRPYLIDFQVSFTLPERLRNTFPVLDSLLWMFQEGDRYHFLKHLLHARTENSGTMAWDLAALRPAWIRLHRWLAVPFRFLRRKLLVRLGIRTGSGRSWSETDPEDAVRRELKESRLRHASP